MQRQSTLRMNPLSVLSFVLIFPLVIGGLAGCGSGENGGTATGPAVEETREVTVYSGRNESLVGPLFERFEEETGIEVAVRYGETAEMAATLMEEGSATPADLFLSQDAAALGAVADTGLFQSLPPQITDRVTPRFRDPQARWIGLSGRARSVVYNTSMVSEDELPRSLEEVTEPRYQGKFGVAPLNGSFQAHMAVYRAARGPEALDQLLAGMVANEPGQYPKNSAIVEAVIRGEVAWGLVNHYYLWRALSEQPDAPAKNFFMDQGEASGFVNAAGVGVLSDNPAALEVLDFLLSEEAQRYFAQETYEYPLATGVEPSVDLVPLDQLQTPDVDYGQVSAQLEETIAAIQASGLLP